MPKEKFKHNKKKRPNKKIESDRVKGKDRHGPFVMYTVNGQAMRVHRPSKKHGWHKCDSTFTDVNLIPK